MDGALATGWPLHLFVTPASEQPVVLEWITADPTLAAKVGQCRLHAQADGDLGTRMAAAMQGVLAAGHDAVVLVGSDVPALSATALLDAVAALDRPGGESRLVFGPARDGGFYLVAGRAAWPDAFTGVRWSTSTALADTDTQAQAVGLDVTRVAPGDDVDTMADLQRLLQTSPSTGAPRTRAWAATR